VHAEIRVEIHNFPVEPENHFAAVLWLSKLIPPVTAGCCFPFQNNSFFPDKIFYIFACSFG
jgi:hypothetical protein